MHSGFVISRSDGRPMYLQIIEQIKERIAVGDWPRGAEIPSIRQLAASLRVSVITIKRVYEELEREGVIVTQQGKPSTVSDDANVGRVERQRFGPAYRASRPAWNVAWIFPKRVGRANARRRCTIDGGSPMNDELAVCFEGVGKKYPHFTLDHIDLELPTGHIMGFIGANGAGKSTTFEFSWASFARIAATVRVLGHPMPAELVAAKRDIGFVSEDMRLYKGATIQWHMDFVRSIFPNWDASYAHALLKRFDITPQQMVKGLSHGQRVKAALLLALARRPKLLVLDEPTTGLDPVARQEVLGALIEALVDEERTVLFSSQNTIDVDQISDRITFIDRGRIVDSGDKETFLDRWRRIRVAVPDGAKIPSLPGVVDVTTSGRITVLTTNRFDPDVSAAFENTGIVVHAIDTMTLEEIFLSEVNGRREREAA